MISLTLTIAGFLVALLCADAYLTRDAIKRSGGRIIEGNKLMKWFMVNDFRAVLITIAASALTIAVACFFVSIGVWYAAVAYCAVGVAIRLPVVLRNYHLNTRIL